MKIDFYSHKQLSFSNNQLKSVLRLCLEDLVLISHLNHVSTYSMTFESLFSHLVTLFVLYWLMTHLSFSWLLGIYLSHSGLKCTHSAKALIVWILSSVQDIFSKPYSNSCYPQRWHRASMQPFRMHQWPQMPAQSQNTDSKGLRVISHSVMILFRNNMGLERSLSRLQRKKKWTGVVFLKLYFVWV